MTTKQGGKKIDTEKSSVKAARPVIRQKRVAKVLVAPKTVTPAAPAKEIETQRRLESLAMIQHVHGDKVRHYKKRSIFSFTRMSHIIEADWSLWHLTWSIIWRVVFIFIATWLAAGLTFAYFLRII
jgi:hypothetical protein